MASHTMLAKYQDMGKLGSGGFGSIVKVCRKRDGMIFARKVVRFPSDHSRLRKLVLDEVHALSTIRHPNIVSYQESFIDPGGENLHIVMEYCERGDLANYIYQAGRGGNTIPLGRIWSIIDQIGLALFRCHHGQNHPQDPAGRYVSPPGAVNIRVYHRDLKPANIFLDKHGSIKLGDFGLCAIMGPTERMRSSFVGTPQYMAPEVVRKQFYSEKSESWGLGCIAHELATLEPTFYVDGDDDVQVSRRIKYLAYPQIAAEYGVDFKQFVTCCFSLNPERRLGMKEVLDNPYVVEARCLRQLVNSQTQWEEEKRKINKETELGYRRREEELQGREKVLAAQFLAAKRLAAEAQSRERALCARDLAFMGRELLVRQQENTMCEEKAKWQQELAAMEERKMQIKAEEEVVRVAKARVEKEYKIRRAELQDLERSVMKKQESLDRHQTQRKRAWASKAADFSRKEAGQAAELKRQVDMELRRKTKSAVRDAKKQVYRAKARSRVGQNPVATASGDEQKGKESSGEKKEGTDTKAGKKVDVPIKNKLLPRLWQAATSTGQNNMPMELGDTFYIDNNLVPYSSDGEGEGESYHYASSQVDEQEEDPLDKMDVGQSFYIRNA